MPENPSGESPVLSAEIAERAAAEGLGRRRAAYGTRSWSAENGIAPKVVTVLGLVPLILAVALDGDFLNEIELPVPFLLAIGVPFTGVGVYILLRNRFVDWRAAGRGLHVFEHGLIVSVGDLPKNAFRWDSMTVFQESVARRHRGRDVVASVYRLERPDGPGSMIGWEFVQPEEWGPRIQWSVAEAQLPDAVRRIGAGEAVAFGSIELTRDGIRNGSHSASWAEAGLRVEEGWLIVEANGRRTVGSRMVGGIPNFLLLQALAEHLRGR